MMGNSYYPLTVKISWRVHVLSLWCGVANEADYESWRQITGMAVLAAKKK